MEKITNENYDLYKRTLGVFWEVIVGDKVILLESEIHPLNVLKNFETVSMTVARKGLRIAIGDSMAMIKDSSKEILEKLNNRLKEEGLYSLDKLIFIHRNLEKKILERGYVKDLAEYFIIKEVISDTSNNMDEATQITFETILLNYEQELKKNRN